MSPAGVDPLIVALHVDHTACMSRAQLWLVGNRLVLRHLAFTGVGHHAEVVLGAELALIAQAGLGLLDGFAGVVLIAARRLARVIPPLLIVQPAGIVGFHIHAVENQAQLAGVVDAHAQLGVGEIFTRPAVVAIAMGGEASGGDGVIHIPRLGAVAHRAGGLQTVAPAAVAAVIAAGLDGVRLTPGFGGHVNHPAGGVAIEGGKRPAQHFYALNAVEIDIRGLPLTIRHRRRDTVHIEANAAHPEGGAGAKTTG